jgi:hypothetical protein
VTFDIAGWSHRLLWGASVDIIAGGDLRVASRPVVVAAPTGGVDPAPGRDLAITVRDGNDAKAVNDLLGRGLELRRRADATVIVPASARAAAIEAADRYGVRFTVAPTGEPGAVLRPPRWPPTSCSRCGAWVSTFGRCPPRSSTPGSTCPGWTC